ncbi:hypothetical protein LLH23_23370 [bacterium]|nr:hypothetical protein [bacterium]
MTAPADGPEKQITVRDLQTSWDGIKRAARQETERRVLGMTALTVGGIALGVGVLGLAFWLGRRSAAAPAVPTEAAPAAPPQRLVAAPRRLDTPLDTAVNALVNAAVKSAVMALTKRLQR